jgi:LPXTG-motif cell wall-anchored protein
VSSPSQYWSGWPEVRADLRSALRLVAGLALAGLPAGLLWWALAPRADFRITADGPVVIGTPSEELLVADDVVFVFVLAGLGLLAGAAAWFLRRRRGVATMTALAVGTSAAGVVAWQLGEWLGAGPTEAQLADVGGLVTSSLTLGSLPGLAVGPFVAVLAYLVGVMSSQSDDLGRTGAAAPALPPATEPVPSAGADRALVDAPPPGWPSA